ncbi:hypothetical protein B5X24_HaOG207101 [Helicoverpa armigera]|uniref:Uncharacterized protein n=1 Tax=Helicoverpa armigera TaxID=29058 RepID=A0A2W1BNI4_HELAM|nr:hypothetical protein B5X24_HaOG207101 [Helicoverpa armigera]
MCLVQQNDPAGFIKYKAYTAKVEGVDITISSVEDEIKRKKMEINFFITTPILELMTLFKTRFDEVRTGVLSDVAEGICAKEEGDFDSLPRLQKAHRAQEKGGQRPLPPPIEWVQGRGTWGSSRPYSMDLRRWWFRRVPLSMHGVGEYLTTQCKR